MQNSRLSKYGKQTLKNRSNFTLLQEINKQQFDDDSPIKNASTVYLDENGKEKQLSEYNSPPLKSKNNDIYLQNESGLNKTDFYALPNKKIVTNEYSEKQKNYSNSVRPAKSEMLRLKQKKEVELKQKKQEDNKKMLNIKRPVNFQRKRNNFQEIDFIGGNLYEIEDIITDINRIIDHTKRTNFIGSGKDQKGPSLKQNKWLNDHFGGGLSKLDELLNSYKSTPEEESSTPIIEEFYRQSTYQKKNIEESSKKNKNSFNFPTKNIKKSQHKLSLAIIKWNQMPMIASKWNSSIYLKLQSFPQQEEYRKVVFKAYQLKIKSYSIFFYPEAGILKGSSKNDKNANSKGLMSQQQYAKTWQQKFPSGSEFTEEQKETLMQFDIEWYRAIIQLCYNSGLQDLLQKQYDVQVYISTMNSIQKQKEVTSQIIVKNQIRYLQEYFELVYPYLSNQTLIGMIRIENDEKTNLKDVEKGFDSIFRKIREQSVDSSAKKEQFSIWSFDLNGSSLVMLLKLCGNRQGNNVLFQKDETILIKLQKPKVWFTLIQQRNYIKKEKRKKEDQAEEKKYIEQRPDEEDDQQAGGEYPKEESIPQSFDQPDGIGYRLILRPSDENDWEVLIKIQQEKFKKDGEDKIKLVLSQQLLFGSLFYIDTDRI